jgi:hypothetical protein
MIDVIKENLELMMKVYISQCVELFVHHSLVDNIFSFFNCLFQTNIGGLFYQLD